MNRLFTFLVFHCKLLISSNVQTDNGVYNLGYLCLKAVEKMNTHVQPIIAR